MYGAYDDITAIDYLAVHVDTEFRKEWDTSAVALDILESDPESNSEVVYWEMQWPVGITGVSHHFTHIPYFHTQDFELYLSCLTMFAENDVQ